MNKRNQYAIQCDRLQMKVEYGREIWNSLIASATRIQPAEFVAACDLDGLLDEEETLEDYVASDPDWACYRSDTAQGQVYMLQTAGFEFFFTPDGLVPAYDPHAIMESHDEYGHSALARLLFTATTRCCRMPMVMNVMQWRSRKTLPSSGDRYSFSNPGRRSSGGWHACAGQPDPGHLRQSCSTSRRAGD